jgi:hypothetical protein
MSNIETVRWFDGQESLPEAGRAVLEDPQLDMVVVRNVGTIGLSTYLEGPRSFPDAAKMRNKLYAEIPALHQLDTTVQEWWSSHPLGHAYRLRLLDTTQTMHITHRGIALHIDEPTRWTGDPVIHTPIEGPLTWSLRIDQHGGNKRLFHAKRTHVPYLAATGLNTGAIEQLTDEIDSRYDTDDVSGISTVEQAPNDMVLFANNPYPTLHAVNNMFGLGAQHASKAIVCSYELLYNAPQGNR